MKFNIATDQGIQVVKGEPIQIGKWKCFITEDEDDGFPCFQISELSSGAKICWDFTKEQAISNAFELFNEHDEQTIIKHCRGILQHNGLNFPLNK